MVIVQQSVVARVVRFLAIWATPIALGILLARAA